jgi:sugar phosphate permease
MWLSSRWGAALTPLLVVVILEHISWRHTFELFGVMGVVWAVFFYVWYRDNPRERKEMNEAEKALLPRSEEVVLGERKVPWGKILRSRTVWLLWVQYICLCYGAVFYFTWLPTYLREGRGLEMRQQALLAAFPLFFAGVGSLFCGYISAPVARRLGSVAAARRLIAGAGFVGAAGCLALSSIIPNPWAAMVVMGLAGFCNDLVMPTSWGTCMDIGGKFAGTISGSMNMMGNAGGALAALVAGYILGWTGHNWNMVLYVAAAVYLAGTFCWLFLDPVTPIEQ